MSKRLTRLIFPLFCVLLLAPWPVAYAYDTANAMESPVRVEVAEAVPSIIAFGKAIGSVTPGDLFYVDARRSAADITVNLYLTNGSQLLHHYRYMILKVGVYVQSDGDRWERATSWDGKSLEELYITLRNGGVRLRLPGYARYRITLDGGSFYCLTTDNVGDGISLRFYLEVDQTQRSMPADTTGGENRGGYMGLLQK